MKYLKPFLLIGAFIGFFSVSHAQYYQIANQLPGLIRPALSGSAGYKGFVDVSYLKGLGDKNVDFVSVSTSQGFRYAGWFYMGVGIGVDIAMAHTGDQFGSQAPGNGYWDHFYNNEYTKTGVMVPVFTDFRFNIGGQTKTSFYIDARIGASFLMSNKWLAAGNGFISNREYFYLKPSLGVRIPVSQSGKQAVDIGVTYQLLTANYVWYSSSSTTVNALGATVSFEW